MVNPHDKLPSYLQSLHQIRPTKPSLVSTELGSDIGQNPTPGSLQINLLFTIYAEQAYGSKPMQTFYFFRRHCRQNRQARHHRFGGAERDRTADPLLAKQVLSQLSYSPSSSITRRLIQVRQQSAPSIPINSLSIIRKCKWWAREDLNFRPHAYQACALTN